MTEMICKRFGHVMGFTCYFTWCQLNRYECRMPKTLPLALWYSSEFSTLLIQCLLQQMYLEDNAHVYMSKFRRHILSTKCNKCDRIHIIILGNFVHIFRSGRMKSWQNTNEHKYILVIWRAHGIQIMTDWWVMGIMSYDQVLNYIVRIINERVWGERKCSQCAYILFDLFFLAACNNKMKQYSLCTHTRRHARPFFSRLVGNFPVVIGRYYLNMFSYINRKKQLGDRIFPSIAGFA